MGFSDQSSNIIDIQDVKIGHWQNPKARTGCTVIIFDKPNVASVHISGGAPGSQETDLLEPSSLVSNVNAILLTGGSAFGLAAASGVRRYLEEKGMGFKAGNHLVPIVPAGVIFDLAVGDSSIRPGPEEGYLACVYAKSPTVDFGRMGVGAGATVGKYLGMEKSEKGGVAGRQITTNDGVTISAILVNNCFGAIVDPENGKTIAGPKDDEGNPISYLEADPPPPAFGSTAIGVVVTDALLTKSDAKRVAMMAHDGLARTVSPSHTPYDGDMIFVVSTGVKRADVVKIGAWSAKMVERCMVDAVSD